MIQGMVNAQREAIVQLRVRGPAGAELRVDALIDSGFTASLALSPAVSAALGLSYWSDGKAMLADGSLQQFDIYEAEVEWDGVWRSVLVWTVSDEAMIGMRLLAGHKLCMEIVPGGAVEINALP